ncbi:hypothetical protein EMUCRT_0560 [Ehrlichia cf. muris str. EmCRT]|uniref:Uncharacterized protein n=2 Tax=Anaplasmataceae TaxID=942 RepID=A0A0F3NC69_9RICK|nr:hypothetical protein EMUCRT_0560 [Ehrlichia cf. muris str. EmCRT]
MFKSKENLNCKGTPESGPSTNVTKSLCSFLMLLLPLTLLLVLFNFLYGVIATVCSIPMLLIALILLPFTKCCLPTANQLYSEGNLDHNSSLTDSDSCCSTASTEYSFAANQEEIQEEEDAVLNSTDMLRCTTSHPLGTNALIGL